jgi:hypothetical protein
MSSTFNDMKRDIEAGWDEVLWSESYGMGDAAALAACVYFQCAAAYLGQRLEDLATKVGKDLLMQTLQNKGKVLTGPGNFQVQAGDAYWSVYQKIWNPLKGRHEKVTTERYVRLYVRYRRNDPSIHDGGGFLLQTGTALHETGDEWDFGLAPNRDLFAIGKRGTGSGTTEVHGLSAAGNYQSFFIHTRTALQETGDEWRFSVAPNRDLFAVKMQGQSSTEIHVISAASNYQQFSLQTGTALHSTDGDNWHFALAENRDMFVIKMQGQSSTEVHILSATSNYQQFSLQTGTALHKTDGDAWDFALAPNRDVFAINKQGGGTISTEVHVLSAASNYQQFALQTGTLLPPTQENWAFAVTPERNLFGIKKLGTGTKSTEVHILDL